MRSVVSQLASPMDSAGTRPDCSTGGRRPPRGKCPRDRSGRVPVRRERRQQAPRQLDLEPDAVGLVGAREHAAALVAQGDGAGPSPYGMRSVARSTPGRSASSMRASRRSIPSPVQRGDGDAVEALDEARQRGVGLEPVRPC